MITHGVDHDLSVGLVHNLGCGTTLATALNASAVPAMASTRPITTSTLTRVTTPPPSPPPATVTAYPLTDIVFSILHVPLLHRRLLPMKQTFWVVHHSPRMTEAS